MVAKLVRGNCDRHLSHCVHSCIISENLNVKHPFKPQTDYSEYEAHPTGSAAHNMEEWTELLSV